MSSHSNWHRKWLNSNWTVKLFFKDNRFFCEKAPVRTSGLHHGLKQKQKGGKKADYTISSKSKTKRLIFLGKFRTISHYMCCTLSMLQMVFPHIPFIYTVVVFGSDQSVYFQLHLHLRWWLCGLKVLRGQWIWLLRLEAACCPCHRKWASPMGSVCYRRSNRPPGNLLVPTISIRDFSVNQSGREPHLWRGWTYAPLFCQTKTCSGSCAQQSKAFF